jgi:integrase/recombinase XerC
VKAYLAWLETVPEGSRALCDDVEAALLVREYKQHLLLSGSTSNSVNAILCALDNLHLFLGLGRTRAKRQALPQLAPRALTSEELRRFLKAVAQTKCIRDRTIAMLMLNCGLRISEVAALNVSDVLLSARKRVLIVRCSKNDKHREIPINRDCGEALQQYLSSEKRADAEAPLFLSRKGNRLSMPAIDRIIRAFGRDSGVELSSHSLRHTCLSQLVRAGVDLVTVAEIGGHSRLETTRRYTLPSPDVMAEAMERLNQAS